MTDQTTTEVTRVLREHSHYAPDARTQEELDGSNWECADCGHTFDVMFDGDPTSAMAAHQATMLAEAGVLRGDGPKRIGRSPGTLYVEIEVTPHDWATRGETFDTWYEASPEQAIAALRGEANRWAAEYGLPQIAAPVPAGQPAAGSAGRGASGGLGERLRALVAGPHPDMLLVRKVEPEWHAIVEQADEVEAAYRVADAEVARLGEFHDHYQAQVERVRAQFVRMTKSSDEKTVRHGNALLRILDGTKEEA